MKIDFKNGVFFTTGCSFLERDIPKNAGFYWEPYNKFWQTTKPDVAKKLFHLCTALAQEEIDRSVLTIKECPDAVLAIPPGEKLFPFQIEAARFALGRNRSYLALDPGLGKTPIAAVIAATLDWSGIYICPPFLTRNTEAEFNKWAPQLLTMRYQSTDKYKEGNKFCILSDSLLHRPEVQKRIKGFIELIKLSGQKALLFIDEAHRYKNEDAARTKVVFGNRYNTGIAGLFDKVVYLSGTPMPNRPIELFPVLNHSASECIDGMNKFEYARRYCGAYQNQWGWDFTGATNMEELAAKVKGTFMLRQKKKDVLKDLPPKTEEIVILEGALSGEVLDYDRRVANEVLDDNDNVKEEIIHKLNLKGENESDDINLMRYRHELGKLKVKPALEYIKYQLDECFDESVIIFALHKKVIEDLVCALEKYEPYFIVGDTPMAIRHEKVISFQNSKKREIIIGNIQAMGTGLTLTKATRVVFVEFDWVPGNNDQASDRAHRIGQNENVLVEYLVYANSVDHAVIKTLLRKKKVIEKL